MCSMLRKHTDTFFMSEVAQRPEENPNPPPPPHRVHSPQQQLCDRDVDLVSAQLVR